MTVPVQPIHSLAGVTLLAGLSAKEREVLEKRCVWRSVSVGEQIVDRQDDTQDIFFIISGAMRVVFYSLVGREISFDDLNAGDHFGEMAAIDGQPRSATVVALEDTTVASISPEVFRELLRHYPDVAFSIMGDLVRVIRRANERVIELSTVGARNRVHAELLRRAKESKATGNVATIHPIPHHADIASRVSTTRETVARELSELTRQGIVRRDADALVVTDVARLADMVSEVRGE